MNAGYVIMLFAILLVLVVTYPVITTLALIGGLYCFMSFLYGIISSETAKRQAP